MADSPRWAMEAYARIMASRDHFASMRPEAQREIKSMLEAEQEREALRSKIRRRLERQP